MVFTGNTIQERFLEAVKSLELKFAVSRIAEKTGYGTGIVSEYLGRKKEVSESFVKEFARVYNFDVDSILFGKAVDSKYNNHSNAQPISIAEDSEVYYNRFGNVFEPLNDGTYLMQVPIITEYARGGRMAGFSDKEYFDELPKHTVVVDSIHKGKYLSFKVAGESMDYDGRDAILDGAIVTGRELKQELWKKSKLHLNKYRDFIIAGADGICVKRITEHNIDEGYIICHSLNPNKAKYKDFTLMIDDIDALFNIIKVENPR